MPGNSRAKFSMTKAVHWVRLIAQDHIRCQLHYHCFNKSILYSKDQTYTHWLDTLSKTPPTLDIVVAVVVEVALMLVFVPFSFFLVIHVSTFEEVDKVVIPFFFDIALVIVVLVVSVYVDGVSISILNNVLVLVDIVVDVVDVNVVDVPFLCHNVVAVVVLMVVTVVTVIIIVGFMLNLLLCHFF